MIELLILTFILFAITLPLLSHTEIIVALTKSFLIGVLYSKSFIEDEGVFENTLQFSFIFILVSMVWDTEK